MNIFHSSLEQWVRTLANASWQAALLIAAVVAATLLLRRARPVIRYALWSVVLIRLCLPFGLTSPLGLADLARPIQGAAASVTARPPAVAIETGHPEHATPVAVAGRASVGAASVVRAGTLLTAWAWCGIVWLLGAAALSAFVLQRWSRLQRIDDASEPCQRPELIALVNELRARFGIARAVALRSLPAGADTFGPCAAGWRQPRILLPARLAGTWELSMLEPILIHELAHIRRADIAVNGVQVLVQIIYWFHPLVWLANARLRRERELICDDFAVLHSGVTSRRYGATILCALEQLRLEPGWSLAGVGMGESGLAHRLRRLLDRGYALPRSVSRVALGALFFAGMLGVLLASDASPKKATPATSTSPSPGVMITKEWKTPADLIPVDPSTGVADGGSAKNWLIANGVMFKEGTSAEYSVRSSRLIVRNTQDQLDLIDTFFPIEKGPGRAVQKTANGTNAPKTPEPQKAIPPDAPRAVAPSPDALITKEWKIPADLIPLLPAPVPPDPSVDVVDRASAKRWLTTQGVVFNGDAAATYIVRGGRLIVRNTQEELDLVEGVLSANRVPGVDVSETPNEPVIPKLELQDATPAEAFKAISAATGIKVFYTPAAAGDEARITVSLTNIPATEAFKYVTALANLKFSHEKDGVHVTAR